MGRNTGVICEGQTCQRPAPERNIEEWLDSLQVLKNTPSYRGFPGGLAGKESACSVGDLGLIPGLGRSPGEGDNYPFQYSGLGCKELDTTEQLSLSCRNSMCKFYDA